MREPTHDALALGHTSPRPHDAGHAAPQGLPCVGGHARAVFLLACAGALLDVAPSSVAASVVLVALVGAALRELER